jgi:hypothetical protein
LARIVLITALVADVALVIAGLGLAPEALRSVTGIGVVFADVAILAAVGAAGLAGPGWCGLGSVDSGF